MLVLNEFELRVLGALIDKQIATPDYYPMTLNALVNACNQMNHRDPVVSYTEREVARAVDSLRDKKLTYTFHASDGRVEKYGHTFPRIFDLDEPATAVLCVLMLRGPQTAGELRSRTTHLHHFPGLLEVEEALHQLSIRDEPLVMRLPRQPGSRESRFAHFLGGLVHIDAAPPRSSETERIARLEDEVSALRQEMTELKQRFDGFSKQFG